MNSLTSRSPHHLPPMRRFFYLFAALAGILISTSLVSAQSVVTNPVGFISTTINAGSLKALSLPVDSVPDFLGPVSARTANTIQTTGATFPSFGPFASNPHLIRVLSGASKGRQFNIASNTTDTLTITTGGTDLTTVIANGDTYEILAAATLQSLFGATGPGLNTNADPALADNVLLRGTSSWFTFYNDGTQWLRQGTGAVSNTTAITPEQAFLFLRRGGTAYTLTLTGGVPTTDLKTDLAANKVTGFGNRFPVNGSLIGLGLDLLPGWNKNADPNLADNVLVRGTSSWITFYYDAASGGPTNGNPGSWVRQGTQAPDQNPIITLGNGVVIVRRGGTTQTLDQALPYSLN
jgi:uncharacterized protein (TIGR02597 family)